MGQEIERKFLVKGDAWRAEAAARQLLRQGYLTSSAERSVRVRLAGEQGFLTVKGPTFGAVRDEWEYEIPAADASEILERLCGHPLLEKIRHRIPFGGRLWEVDEFLKENAGLVVAEVETGDADATLTLPPWAGKEVTEDPRYLNANLARTPWTTWPSK